LPYTDSLALTDGIVDVEAAANARVTAASNDRAALTAMVFAMSDSIVRLSDTTTDERSSVRQLDEALTAQRAQRRIAKSEYLPSLTLSSSYGRLAFPTAVVPSWNQFVNNWTVSVGASMPLFTGGRIRGDNVVAQANVAEAKARLQQTKELASLDARQAVAELQQAVATLAASGGTADQATRAYNIAEVRFKEGLVDAARAHRIAAPAPAGSREPSPGRPRLPGRSAPPNAAEGSAARRRERCRRRLGSRRPHHVAVHEHGWLRHVQQQQPQQLPRAGSSASVSGTGQPQ
jgi:hypothetical protein